MDALSAGSPAPDDERDPGPLGALDAVAEAVDDLVPLADTVENRVLPDNSRTTRLAGPLFAACALILLPWIVFIALTLPSRQLSPNYDIAWAGYDAMLFAALASTAACALRRSRYLVIAATWSAALLVADAWFDVLTSPSGADRLEAIAMAVLVELPLAGVCGWLARHSEDIAEQRLALLLRRRR